jgi:hypothetical protein
MARTHNPADPAAQGKHEPQTIPAGPAYKHSDLLPGLRVRHDGWTAQRTQRFLDTLGHTGCVRDAARVAGVSNAAGYKLKARFPLFSAAWDDALARANQGLVAIAYKRAVEGKGTVIIRNGTEYERRIAPSDSMLGLLVKRGDMAGGHERAPDSGDVLTADEAHDGWTFDATDKKIKGPSHAELATEMASRMKEIRERVVQYAKEKGVCWHCEQRLTDESIRIINNRSIAEQVAMGVVPISDVM